MKTKHTKGKWIARDLQIKDINGGIIANVDPIFALAIDENVANAKLIASAPELLELLIELHEKTLYKLSEKDFRDNRQPHELFDRIEAVIKKATE